LEKIARAVCPERVPLLIEIGPGKGALTEHLLDRADRVVAIEVDSYLVHYLRQKFRGRDNLTIVENDVLKTDLAQWGPAAIAGNLPYYITSPILDRIFALGDAWTRAVVLVQKEVAERITAKPGSRDYGYLSVVAQLYSAPELLFAVSRAAFQPAPKVDSAAVRLERRDPGRDWGLPDPRAFLQFTGIAFRHKRKTLRNNLIAAFPKEQVAAAADPRVRAEQLAIEQLIGLYRKLNCYPEG
jgi:16S rRNA (adenine1518-N6/adenine1519-N6)-dimethyltransferase